MKDGEKLQQTVGCWLLLALVGEEEEDDDDETSYHKGQGRQ